MNSIRNFDQPTSLSLRYDNYNFYDSSNSYAHNIPLNKYIHLCDDVISSNKALLLNPLAAPFVNTRSGHPVLVSTGNPPLSVKMLLLRVFLIFLTTPLPQIHTHIVSPMYRLSLDATINHNRSKGLNPNVLLVKEKIMVKDKFHFFPVNEGTISEQINLLNKRKPTT